MILQGTVGKLPDPYGILAPGRPSPATGSGFSDILNNLAGALVAVAGIALFLNLLMGGLRYLTAGGDSKAVESAKKMITNSIVGMSIVAAAYFLALMIRAVTGFDITDIKIGY